MTVARTVDPVILDYFPTTVQIKNREETLRFTVQIVEMFSGE